MGLLSFLKRKSGDAAARPAAVPESADSVQQARTRARQRLVGAVVLVGAGVIGFPLLFETQPRLLPGDTPIDIARKDAAAPSAPARTTPAPRANVPAPLPDVVTESAADAGREVVVAAASAPAATVPASQAAPRPPESRSVEPKPPEPKAEVKPEAKPKPETKPAVDSARAQALLEGKPGATKPAAVDGRFIVQVGAFAEVTAAREARQKVERLGLKTYTQVVETSSGKRIRVRVGPFASREEADKASNKIKSAGLASAVYTL